MSNWFELCGESIYHARSEGLLVKITDLFELDPIGLATCGAMIPFPQSTDLRIEKFQVSSQGILKASKH